MRLGLLLLVLFLGGCAGLDRVGDALTGQPVGGPGMDTQEEHLVGVAQAATPFLPSPWKEAVAAIMGGLATYSYQRRMPPGTGDITPIPPREGEV